MLICTICAANYLPKVACLAKSLIATQGPHKFLVCLAERDCSAASRFPEILPKVILASELGVANFDVFMFRQASSAEACCAVKAQFLLWILEKYPEEEHFLYLDPDIRSYSRFQELESTLVHGNIILTPHFLIPDHSVQIVWSELTRTLPCGIFNAGFVAFRRSPEALEFLHWWNRKLQTFCEGQAAKGFYFDQKWLDLAVSFFDFTILNEPGYNVAHWNIFERYPTLCPETRTCLVNGMPLRCFHFSMIDSGRDMMHFKKYLDDDNPIFTMRAEYLHDISTAGAIGHSSEWSYGQYRSGESIDPMARSVFRPAVGLPHVAEQFADPFRNSNSEILAEVGRHRRHT